MNRLVWAALALAAGATLSTARWLPPSPSGLGTHRALGLPPCGFLALTGLPCPSCGLTTAFALLARGEWLASLRAHPLGLPLFLLVVLLLALALDGLRSARSLAVTVDRLRLDRVALLVVFALGATWAARLLR